MHKAAIDFGTTNTVAAIWRQSKNAPETISLPGLSIPLSGGLPALIPSLIYVLDGRTENILVGQMVRGRGRDIAEDRRFFSSFKRGITARTRPLARIIDGAEWDEPRAGRVFIQAVLDAVLAVTGSELDELVLTVPVESFEAYLKWLRDEASLVGAGTGNGPRRLRVVDESTAAALGYQTGEPGELVLVIDFGGGTLDISLVRMPITRNDSGIVFETGSTHMQDSSLNSRLEARVVAKVGRVLGGDDIDHWLLDDLLVRNDKKRQDIGVLYPQLKRAVEMAKIQLSDHESAQVSVCDPDTSYVYQAVFTRSQLEDVLDRQGFFLAVQRTINKVLRIARARGIFPEDIGAVLLIGGTSLMPSVRRMIRAQFEPGRVYDHLPFEAVAHGALGLAAGVGLDDLLYHAYGVRHLSPTTGRHEWEEIIPAGTRYPLEEPVKLVLTASRDGQEALELVIGEVEESAGGLAEVMFGERSILMVNGGVELRKVVPLNDQDGSRTVARLDPPGRAGEDRVEVTFTVDPNRTLRVTVVDLLTDETLLYSVPVVELR